MAIMPATENAQWRTLYDAVRGAAYGTSYTYAELNVLAGVTDVTHQRWILIRTREELVRHDRRFLANVRGVGYRIVDAEEHLRVGNAYRERSMRQAGKSVKVLESTDLSQIPDPTTRTAIINLHTRMGRIEQEARHQSALLDTTVQTTDRLVTEYLDQSDRLRAVEEKLREIENPEA